MNMINTLSRTFLVSCDANIACVILNACRAQAFFYMGKTLGKYFHRLFPFHRDILAEYTLCTYYTEDYKLMQTLYKRLFKFRMSETELHTHTQNYHLCIQYVKDVYTHYNGLYKPIKTVNDTTPFITFTITTCKRLELFERTINSFLHCCVDKHLINHWLCVDDNSSDSDRERMKQRYPFFTFYLKTPEEKGHAKSMNIIRSLVKTPYVFHMEDDWQFFEKRNYITECLEVLNEDKSYGQCLINKNYSETASDAHEISGGLLRLTKHSEIRYFIHEYCKDETELEEFKNKYSSGNKQCAYWPHFSLRPSLLRTHVWSIGDFNEKAEHFEMEYAHRYIATGFKSVFLERIYAMHIGRLTSERHDETKLNAYTLNNETQFKTVKTLTLYVYVINLESRPDRLQKFYETNSHKIKLFKTICKYSAIDGKTLVSTPQLQRIFEGNDYNMRSGMVGCAMSHINLYIKALGDEDGSLHLIFEDDIVLTDNFMDKFSFVLGQLQTLDWDMVYLGHHIKPEYIDSDTFSPDKMPVLEKWSVSESLEKSLGGTGGYLINTRGATKLLEYINVHGMINCIDTIQQKSGSYLNIYYCKTHMFKSEVYSSDSDIQFNAHSLTVDINTRLERDLLYLEKYSNVVYCETLEDLKSHMNNPITTLWSLHYFTENVNTHITYNLIGDKCIYYIYIPLKVYGIIKNNKDSVIFIDRLKVDGKFDITQTHVTNI